MKKRVLSVVAVFLILSVFSTVAPLPATYDNMVTQQAMAKKKIKYTKAQKKLAVDIGYYAGENLKYPKSFKIEGIFKVKINPTDEYIQMLQWAAQTTSGMTVKKSDYVIVWEVDYKAKNSYGTYVKDTMYINKSGLAYSWDEIYDDIEEGYYVDTEKLGLVSDGFVSKVKTLTKKYIKKNYY